MLTMRLFAEERRSGTIEVLLTVPVTETEVVLAKWLAGVVMYCVLLVPFALYSAVPLLSRRNIDFDLGPIFCLGLGLTTMGMMFVAIGVAVQRAHAQPDHRGDLDVRHPVRAGRDLPRGLSVRGAPARRVGRRPAVSWRS